MGKKKQKIDGFRVGTAVLLGRPNSGKSTILNAILGQKVAAVSPRPQTTQALVHTVWESESAQVFFLDTPGWYKKAEQSPLNILNEAINEADVLVYVVDHTRAWGDEEQRMWNLVQLSNKPFIVAVNKVDVKEPSYMQDYTMRLAERAELVIEVSGLKNLYLQGLLNEIMMRLPVGERNPVVDTFTTPLLSHSSFGYLEDLIREKIYLFTNEEVPYQTHPQVLEVAEDEQRNRLTISAVVQVTRERYKPILIGRQGKKIKQIGQAVRKELEVATGKQVVVKLQVVV